MTPFIKVAEEDMSTKNKKSSGLKKIMLSQAETIR